MERSLPNLSKRLELTASFVRRGVKVADIGTDHAYLPVYLVNSGLCESAVASDVKEGPLERAKMTAALYNAGDKVSFMLTDGLDGVLPSQADDIVIAGMGGELITEIIRKCQWLKNPQKHLVLQPMTAQEELHDFLCGSGFKIEKEAVAAEKHGSKLYLVISAFYCGERRAADKFCRVTGKLADTGGANERAYLKKKARALQKKASGLSMAKNESAGEAETARDSMTLAAQILKLCETMK